MDRQTWLAERRKGIGSSDAAAVCGLSPYRTALEVYLDKLGLLPEQSSPAMTWGLKLEEVIAEAYTEETGREVIRPTMMLACKHPPMLANLDCVAMDRIVELKTARSSEGWGRPGTDEVPEGYLIQVQHQMAVGGIALADVAVLIGGSDFRVYTVPANAALQRKMIEIEGDFWKRVEERRPPEPDWTDPRTPELIALLNRPVEGTEVALGENEGHLVDVYETLGQRVKDFAEERDRVKARLVSLMGAAEAGHLPDGRSIRRGRIERRAYEVPASTYYDFRIRKSKVKRG